MKLIKTWSWIKVEMFILCISSIALHVRRGWLSRLEISFWLTTASRQQHTTCVLLKLQIRQLNTVVEPSCASRSCSVYCVPAWWRPLTRQRRARSSASFYRSKRTTAVPCAGCRRRTGRWRTSSTESTVCHCRVWDVAAEQDAEEHPAPSPLCVIIVCGMSPPNRTLKNIQHRVHCVSSCNHGCPSRCQAVNYWKTAKLCQLFYYEPCSYDTQDDCVIYRVTSTELLIHLWFLNQSIKLNDRAHTKQR